LMCSVVLLVFLTTWASGAGGTLDLEQRLSGRWQLTSCSCAADAFYQCKDIFVSDYDFEVRAPGTDETQFSSFPVVNGTATPDEAFWFVVDMAGVPHTRNLPYDCAGVWTDQLLCVNTTTDETACTIVFDCLSGDCIGSVIQQRLRSIMFPVVGILAGILWFIFPFTISNPTVKIIALTLSVIQVVFALTMLAAPLIYVPLLAVASGAFTFHVYYTEQKGVGSYAVVAALAMWLFLVYAGVDTISNGSESMPFFESLMASFNSRECYWLLGTPLSDPRCREYILYCGVMSYMITAIQPGLVLCAWGSWRLHPTN